MRHRAATFKGLRGTGRFSSGVLGHKALPRCLKPDQGGQGGTFWCCQRGSADEAQLPGQLHRLLALSSGAGGILHGQAVKVVLLQGEATMKMSSWSWSISKVSPSPNHSRNPSNHLELQRQFKAALEDEQSTATAPQAQLTAITSVIFGLFPFPFTAIFVLPPPPQIPSPTGIFPLFKQGLTAANF